ncbi:hypothetical protein OHA72_34160 [Dactylosporangium sp. NBC_01737]|uniref:hypothetical protein n=1 Tax=Dactylosporangium sp. NBC_01737 TaxID=2975959 RepID=UPI002E162E85|nr:hypothetical protein OHA72_34160 [Dactylosporangium sp. NBC_01737]
MTADPGEVFVCQFARQGLSPRAGATLTVVETRFHPQTGYFGYAWLTEDGERAAGTDRGLDLLDSLVQAMCRAALELLGAGRPGVHLVCWNRKAIGLLRETLTSGPATPAPQLSEGTRALLARLKPLRHSVTTQNDPCKDLHRGTAEAEHLAAEALQAAHGLRVGPQLPDAPGPGAPGTAEDGPDERDDPGAGHLTWQTALLRAHLDGGWCALPEGELPEGLDPHPRLRLEHRPGPASAHEVTLRRRDGRWELSGIRWPQGLRPGVLVTCRWPHGTDRVTASTTALPVPERFDDVEFLHRYDPQVATREHAPGCEQHRAVPHLSDVGWVLRTLRTLGHLSADGTATLAEKALVRNCQRLHMPRSQVARIGRAVQTLLQWGRIERVPGSIDEHGHPWHPGRTGQVRADLLRYVPHVAPVDASARQDADGAWPGRRGHAVTGFVRRLPPGRQASGEQLDLHHDAVLNAEVVDRPLPEGYTYVRPHHRGSHA